MTAKISYRKRGRPLGSVTVEEGSPSTVHVTKTVRSWLADKNFTLSAALRNIPTWKDELDEIRIENAEMKENIAKYQKQVVKLLEENADLLKFKDKVRMQLKEKVAQQKSDLLGGIVK